MITAQLVRKINRMTLLVGIVGLDGIVFAADQRVASPSDTDDVMDQDFGVRKIQIVPGDCFAFACAGDFVSHRVGDAISEALSKNRFDFGNTEDSLRTIAVVTCAKVGADCGGDVNTGVNRSILAVSYREEPTLWLLKICNENSRAFRVTTIAITGAAGNPARFFSRYYAAASEANRLKLLAAHIVTAGSKRDSLMVDGLDLAVFKKQSVEFATVTEAAELQKRSEQIDAMIRDQIYLSLG